MKSSNDLRYSETKIIKGGKEKITVNIRLNDECKNGHQDFSITGDMWELAGNNRWVETCGGCIHDEILKYFPQFKIFVDLHLCDYTGVPMHPTANGFYHLQNGFNNTPATSDKFKGEYCEYYRITPSQYDVLSQSKSEIQFYLHLKDLHILDQWKKQANEGIAFMEQLTNSKFVVDSKRTQLVVPSDEDIAAELQRIADGYYTPEAYQQRHEEAINKEIEKRQKEIQDKFEDAKIELSIKEQVLRIGGFKAYDDCIYYNHTKTLAFNWRTYTKGIDEDLFNKIKSEIQLPEGVKIVFKG